MQYWHVKGNDAADVLADKGAEFHTIPIDKGQHILDLVNNLKIIQNRIIYVITFYAQRPHNIPILPKQEITYKQRTFNACRLSQHKLYVHENRINCMHCHAWVSIHTKYSL